MAPINYLCLSFILGLFTSVVFIPNPSFTVSAITFLVLLIVFLKWGRHNRLIFAVMAFYLLGILRPAFAWDYHQILDPMSQAPWVSSVRQGITASLDKVLPQPHSSLAYGMLFGVAKGQGFDRDFLLDLRRTGTAHMVAVSGYNVSIIIGILLNTSILLVSKGLLVFGLAGLLFYDLIVGFSASVARATVMGLYLFVAGLFGRQRNFSDALLFSAALILALSPRALLDLGFQFSFLAMMAVLYLSPLFERMFRFLPAQAGLPKELNKVVSATLASQVMILPVSVYSFGQVSLIAPLANVLTFITVPAIMALTALSVLLGYVSFGLSGLISIPNFVLLDYFVKVVGFLSSLKWASVTF